MFVLKQRNVHETLPEAILMLTAKGIPRDTRYGPVLEFPEPVTTVYNRPKERVIFHPERDANPFFHLFEALWMLGGRDDVAYVAKFAKRMASFSDDGVTFHGAYGYRWRHHFGFDQLGVIVDNLKKNSNCRRQMLQMWDANTDLHGDQESHKDLPCNTIASFQINNEGALNMYVFCRSNDIVWGCYGANAVHFSVLLEYVAACVGVPVGVYEQISCNWHGYVDTLEPLRGLADIAADPFKGGGQILSPYQAGHVSPFPLMSKDKSVWDQDLVMFLDEGLDAIGYRDPYFRKVAIPMLRAHGMYKAHPPSHNRHKVVMDCLEQVVATDWRRAAMEWVKRRHDKWLRVKDDGVVYE